MKSLKIELPETLSANEIAKIKRQIEKIIISDDGERPSLTEEIIEKGGVRLRWYDSDPPRFELSWPDVGGDTLLPIPNIDALWSWSTLRKLIAERWKTVVDDMKPDRWHSLLTLLIERAEFIAQPGASENAEVLSMLEGWLQDRGIERWSGKDIYHAPILKDGYYYFRLETFESGALFAPNSRYHYQRYLITRPKLYKILGTAGAQTTVKNFRGKSIRVWMIPADFNRPKEPAEGELAEPEDEA